MVGGAHKDLYVRYLPGLLLQHLVFALTTPGYGHTKEETSFRGRDNALEDNTSRHDMRDLTMDYLHNAGRR